MRQARFVIIAAMLLTLATPSVAPAGATIHPDAHAQTTASTVGGAYQSVDDADAIYRLYVAYFDRAPDASGLWFWIDQHRAGASLASISDQFATSPEFNIRYGSINDAAFVALVYESVLDRVADPDGLTHWRNQMNKGMTRGALMIQFSESLEFKMTTGFLNVAEIQRLYRAVFLRSPDAQGLNYWLTKRASGLGLDAMATTFTSSPEFFNRYGALNNTDFVILVYRNVLGRTPDDSGLAYWIDRLDSVTRGELLIGFSNSPEYQTRTGIVDRPAPVIPERPADPTDGVNAPPVVVPPARPSASPPSRPRHFSCDFEVDEAELSSTWGTTPYRVSLRYVFDVFIWECRGLAQDGALTLIGPNVDDWEFTKHTYRPSWYPDAVASIDFNIPESAFDADLGINIDASYVVDNGNDSTVKLDWEGYFYLPLHYDIESVRHPEHIPFEQMTAWVPVTVQPNPAAPNRPIVVQVRRSHSGPTCVPAGWQDGDSWTDVATGVAPITVDVEIDLTNALRNCHLEVRANSGQNIGWVNVYRLSPNVEDFVIGGTSTCAEGSCDATITFEFVPSIAHYSALIVPLADVPGIAHVRFDTDLLEPGTQTFAIPHIYVDGFCVSISASTASSSFRGTQTPYRCYLPDSGGWSEVPVPEGRFGNV